MKLKIVNDSLAGYTAKVWIDGTERPDVERVELIMDANAITRVRVTFLAEAVEADVEAQDDLQ